MASPLTEIPDHLLAEIFLRLPDPADLARASAACVTFRRLVTDGSFLCRFRRLHAPPLLAVLDRDGFHPALLPHPSAPAACALALAADFSFSFLPSHCRWIVQDIRDGRVLLGRDIVEDEEPPIFAELVVCDPLHRAHILLPQVPNDLAASSEHSLNCCVPSLLPLSEEAGATEETSFKVIWLACYQTRVAAFVFSSSNGQWRAAASKGWSDLAPRRADSFLVQRFPPLFVRRHYAYGCFYWDCVVIGWERLLMLDARRMEFSIVDLLPGGWSMEGVAILEAGEGRLGMFRFHGEIASDLSYAIARNKGESLSQWQMEKTISLDPGYRYYIKAATQRCLLLIRTQRSSVENQLYEYFSMDVKTLQLQRVCVKQCGPMLLGTHIYTNFPPSLLSSRTI